MRPLEIGGGFLFGRRMRSSIRIMMTIAAPAIIHTFTSASTSAAFCERPLDALCPSGLTMLISTSSPVFLAS